MRPFRVAILSGGLHSETQAWVSAASAVGGVIPVSWSRAVDQILVRPSVADGLWDSIFDMALLCGSENLTGALVRLKTPSGVSRVLTNNNFVSGDYTPSGASAGLRKAGNSSAFLQTGVSPNVHLSLGSASMSVYGSLFSQASSLGFIGSGSTGDAGYAMLDTTNPAGPNRISFSRAGTTYVHATAPTQPGQGFVVGTAIAANDMRLFENGVQVASQTGIRTEAFTTQPLSVYAYNQNGTNSRFSTARLNFYHIGLGLSASQVSALSNRVNALMASIGANQY